MSSAAPAFATQAFAATPEQLAVQTSDARTLLIEANAGAAKTTTLALRMAEGWARGIRPEDFLALTHTDTACQALRAALQKIGVPAPVVQRFRVVCFEDFCTFMLQDAHDGAVASHRTLEALQPFVWQAVQRVQDSEGERWPEDLELPSLGDAGFVEDFVRLATWLKGTMQDALARGEEGGGATPEYAAALGVGYTPLKVFLAYERIRHRELADQPLFRGPGDATYDLALWLHGGGAAAHLPRWPRATQVVLVDEMHDMHQASFRVLQELLNTTNAFFCGVGDRDQVIHSASGADSVFMGDALAVHTARQPVRLPLTPSHRFGPRLAAKAARLAGKPYSSLATHDTAVALLTYQSAADCTAQVVQEAQRWRATPRTRMADFAVLLRHPSQSVLLENALLAAGLPYTLSGFDSYLLRPEVLLVRGLLAVATDNFDSVSEPQTRERVMQALVFFGGARIVVAGREHESQQDLLADAVRSITDNPLFLLSFFDHQILPNVAPRMRRRLQRAVDVARAPAGPQLLERLLAALEMDAIVREVLVSQERRAEALGNLAGLCQAAQAFDSAHAYFLHLNAAEEAQRKRKGAASLVLASIAHVKGLEFEQVVIPYLERGVFPLPQASAVEEQNTLYVGMTRARRQLTLLAHATRPSRFVAQLGYAPATPAAPDLSALPG